MLDDGTAEDFVQELTPDRPREVEVIVRRHNESAGTADDVLFVIAIELRIFVEDRKAVDREARRDQLVPHIPRRAAGVGSPVA